MRTIDADALIEKCGGWYVDECTESGFIGTLENLLATEPTVQPEPHEGEWINTNPEYKNGFYNNSYYCSECHDYYTTSPYEMKFCPNCGAKMRGERQK